MLSGLALVATAGLAFWLRTEPRRHLLLITLDTTRGDHNGCYGYQSARTPLDSLAAAGVMCEHAFTVAPLTLPAHASLMTGLYPAEHGIRTNGRGRLEGGIPVLAEILRRQGYDTAAFVAAFVLDRKFGLDRGFKVYDDDVSSDDPTTELLHRQRQGAEVVDAAIEWLGQKRSEPFFCWVHLFDPHAPYLAHADLFDDEFADRPYDAEIAYVDRQIGRLMEFLASRGLDSRTLVVVAGDHGEGLDSHFERNHGQTLYNSTMHVPLIFSGSEKLLMAGESPQTYRWLTSRRRFSVSMRVADPRKVTGRSIVPLLRGGADRGLPCYGATDEPYLSNGWSSLRSLTDENWKYIRTSRVELYDLASDPGELHNLAESLPAKTRLMESRLVDFETRLVPRAVVDVQLSPAERRTLASLGYVAGSNGTPDGPVPANLPDVKDMLPFDASVEDAEKLIGRGQLDEAVERLATVVRDAPSHTRANWSLAWALWDRGEFDEAQKVLLRLVAAKPDCRDGHFGLGLMHLKQGRLEGAIIELRKTLEIDPELPEAHMNLGKACAAAGRLDEALTEFDAVLELDKRSATTLQFRAYTLANLGRVDHAIAAYRAALKSAPGSAEMHHNLGVLLADHGAADECLRHLSRAVELNPRGAELQFALGAFLLRQRQFDQALLHLTRALELKPGYSAAETQLQAARQALLERGSTSE